MSWIRTIISIFLAGIVLISSVGITVNQHICMGQVRSTALFVKPASCGMTEASEQLSLLMKGKGCCHEKSILVKSKTTSALSSNALDASSSCQLIAVLLPVLYRVLDSSQTITLPEYARNKPPLLACDRTILVHALLI